MTEDEPARARSSIAFVAMVVPLIVLYGFFFGFVVITDAGISADEAVHVAAALGFAGTLVAGLVSQVAAPRRWPAGLWVTAAGIVAFLIAGGIVGDPDNYGGQAGPFDLAYLIFLVPLLLVFALHPSPSGLIRGGRPDVMLVVAVAAVCIPLVVYGVDQALIQRNSWPPKSDPHHNAHWFTMAGLAFAIPVVGFVSASRLAGWRIATWCAAGMAVIIGVTSVIWSDAASSLGVWWGIASTVGGAGFLVLASRQRDGSTPGQKAPTSVP